MVTEWRQRCCCCINQLSLWWNTFKHNLWSHVTSFHWLPIRQRVTFKISSCSCGSMSMVLLLHIYRNSVCQSKTSEGVHGYSLHLLDVFIYRRWGLQRKVCVPWAVSLEHCLPSTLRDSSLSLRAFKGRSAKDVSHHSSVVHNNKRNTIRRCRDVFSRPYLRSRYWYSVASVVVVVCYVMYCG